MHTFKTQNFTINTFRSSMSGSDYRPSPRFLRRPASIGHELGHGWTRTVVQWQQLAGGNSGLWNDADVTRAVCLWCRTWLAWIPRSACGGDRRSRVHPSWEYLGQSAGCRGGVERPGQGFLVANGQRVDGIPMTLGHAFSAATSSALHCAEFQFFPCSPRLWR
jgi:hypothetical protein